MLTIKKNEDTIILIQNNKEYHIYYFHLLLGVMFLLGIMPPVFILVEAQRIYLTFFIIIYICMKIKNRKIPKQIFINLTKENIEIKKKKESFIFNYDSIKEILISENKERYYLEILTYDKIYKIETIFKEEAEIIKNILLKQRKEFNEI